MPDTTPAKRYGVIGHPIEHSRSPQIHTQFASQFDLALSYERILAPLDGFAATVDEFFRQGSGLNVTLPFKEQAYDLASPRLSRRAHMAGAVNTLWLQDGQIHGCNTDGVGLCSDLLRVGHNPEGKRILLIGAGGASRGVVFPLLEAGCELLHIINRTSSKAYEIREQVVALDPDASRRLSAGGLDDHCGDWDIVINATSASLNQNLPELPDARYRSNSLAYDMFYASEPTAFMQAAEQAGATHSKDGLGMLVGQAAASFQIWHGVQPDVEPVLAALRQAIGQN
ncbi:shikimate dehydrogenase (NADP(+)) [Alcaligenes pakistanensis]|uniref:Shikimate dehydrogenase (NADP(+)) n=1 Tax=Alcaligenes pakistanensis TaxID=1482717 RepID=A0A8H9M4W4_9BURK|nr:shikimate dehydrogenase [Alcaligenes pakistanensis]MBP6620907.1 shikimate dehydrogenase [Alcaligenes sp.]GHC48609.1 shikimate dehydrogenase (NADP(+)) [Alcaligenes pakistanensis]HCA17613.1 shikimate dehydrogenase [Alcaligenes faecalis]